MLSVVVIALSVMATSCEKSYQCKCKSKDNQGLYTIQQSQFTVKGKNFNDAQNTCSKYNTGDPSNPDVGCGIGDKW